ncbi:MAG TPA: VWA containing CoxE family protein, partial [Myxococcota bacterium]|nr:VWA containing CoxE family protein [Myxococcota bacterium]
MKPGGLLLGFFYRLRARGLKVTPHQWLALVEGLARGLHGSSLMGFYSLARCLLVKDEGELDDFDQAFAEHFQGAPEALPGLEAEVLAWLESPIPPY